MVAKPPADTSYRSPNFGGYSTPRHVEAWCVHITDGSNSLGWLCNPVSQASANYLLSRNGYLYELVPPDIAPWTNGDVQAPDMANPLIAGWVRSGVNCNTKTLTVECEGYTTSWQPGALTDAQEYVLVWLLAWGCAAYLLPPDATHIIRHQQLNNVTRHNCPGFSAEEWTGYIAATAALVAGGTPLGGEVQEPPPGTALGYINAKGEAIYVWNAGGEAVAVVGANAVDVGLTVRNKHDEQYSVSLQHNAQQPWLQTSH